MPLAPAAAEDNPMGSMSIWHWIIVLAVGLLLFGGRGKISELMGDFAKGHQVVQERLVGRRKGRGAREDPTRSRPSTISRAATTGAPVASGATAGTSSEARKAG